VPNPSGVSGGAVESGNSTNRRLGIEHLKEELPIPYGHTQPFKCGRIRQEGPTEPVLECHYVVLILCCLFIRLFRIMYKTFARTVDIGVRIRGPSNLQTHVTREPMRLSGHSRPGFGDLTHSLTFASVRKGPGPNGVSPSAWTCPQTWHKPGTHIGALFATDLRPYTSIAVCVRSRHSNLVGAGSQSASSQ
jgi:hypothetical protein